MPHSSQKPARTDPPPNIEARNVSFWLSTPSLRVLKRLSKPRRARVSPAFPWYSSIPLSILRVLGLQIRTDSEGGCEMGNKQAWHSVSKALVVIAATLLL